MKFPAAPYTSARSYLDAYVEEMTRAAKTVEPETFDRAATILTEAYARGRRMFSCGNGGSASIANHMQCDHVKGIRNQTDLAPQVLSLSTNVELLTAIANDLGYENVFAYQLQSQARPGDVLIAVSSSGRSPNIVHASPGPVTMGCARSRSPASVAARPGPRPRSPSTSTAPTTASWRTCTRVVMHALAQYIRQSRMTAEAISTTLF